MPRGPAGPPLVFYPGVVDQQILQCVPDKFIVGIDACRFGQDAYRLGKPSQAYKGHPLEMPGAYVAPLLRDGLIRQGGGLLETTGTVVNAGVPGHSFGTLP
jgi:hypothetical protein